MHSYDNKEMAVSVAKPRAEIALPLVCDSPHSGIRYPRDFGFSIAMSELRFGEDTHVEKLFGHAPEVGATLIAANFPRTYIDPNRELRDLDESMLDGPWPGPLLTSAKTQRGVGLVWREVRRGAPIYDRKLSVSEVQRRIDRYWRPYHEALQASTDEAVNRYGGCWHLNLHSMPANTYERLGVDSPTPLADFVLGDRRGTSCDAEFVAVVRQAIEARGYRVAVNDPFAGQELVRLNGRPEANRHSLQVEVNRAIYMNEATREPSPGFEGVRSDLSIVLGEVSRYVTSRCVTEAGTA